VVSTQYLLIYEKRLYKERRKVENRETMKEEEKRKRLGDGGCTFAPRSHTAMGPYPLSKLNASGLSTRKWTKLLMMMLHGCMEGSCLSHSMTMCSRV